MATQKKRIHTVVVRDQDEVLTVKASWHRYILEQWAVEWVSKMFPDKIVDDMLDVRDLELSENIAVDFDYDLVPIHNDEEAMLFNIIHSVCEAEGYGLEKTFGVKTNEDLSIFALKFLRANIDSVFDDLENE